MAHFSDNDINEAKRRVWEMRNRASHYVDDAPAQKTVENSRNTEKSRPEDAEQKNLPQNPLLQLLGNFGTGSERKNDADNSTFIILAMIMILSKEGADNTLILALLYLLL